MLLLIDCPSPLIFGLPIGLAVRFIISADDLLGAFLSTCLSVLFRPSFYPFVDVLGVILPAYVLICLSVSERYTHFCSLFIGIYNAFCT